METEAIIEELPDFDGNSGEFIQLVDDGLQYLGPRDLTQYFIRYMT